MTFDSFLKRLKKENLGLVTRDESESHHGDPDALEGAVTNEEANKVGISTREDKCMLTLHTRSSSFGNKQGKCVCLQ